MADEQNTSSEVSHCPPGAITNPPGQKPSLEETLVGLNQNMGNMADMLGKMYQRLDQNALSQRPPGPRGKRHRRKSSTDSAPYSETDDDSVPPHGKSRRKDDDALSVHASNSDDDLNNLLHSNSPPVTSKDTEKAEND